MATLGLVSGLAAAAQADTTSFDFSRMATLDPRWTFTGGEARTYYNERRELVRAAANEPRFETDMWRRRGIRMDPSSTNLCLNSEDPAGLGVNARSASKGPNKVVAGMVVCRITPNTANTDHSADRLIPNQPEGTVLSFQWAVRRAGYDFVRLAVYAGSGSTRMIAVLNLITGEVSGYSGQSGVTVTSEPLAEGFWLIKVEGITVLAGTTEPRFRLTASDTGASSTSIGDGIKGFDIGCGQAEVGPYCTSYIPTGSAAVTRGSESLTLGGQGFQDAIKLDSYTLFADMAAISKPTSALSLLLLTNNGFQSNMSQLRSTSTGNQINGRTQVSNGGYQTYPTVNVTPATEARKTLVLRNAAGVYTAGAAGVLGNASGSFGSPTLTQLNLGNTASVDMPMRFFGARIYKAALANADLIRLSAS